MAGGISYYVILLLLCTCYGILSVVSANGPATMGTVTLRDILEFEHSLSRTAFSLRRHLKQLLYLRFFGNSVWYILEYSFLSSTGMSGVCRLLTPRVEERINGHEPLI